MCTNKAILFRKQRTKKNKSKVNKEIGKQANKK